MKLSFNSYLSIGLTVIAVILLIYCLSLRNSRDNAVNRLDKLNEQLNTLTATNKDLKGTIDLLKIEAEQNDRYIVDLDNKRKESESRANELLNRFRNDKRTNQTINTWANQSLPNGLY